MKANGRIIKTVKKKEPLDETSAPKQPDADFWQHKSAEELAEEQCIQPIRDEKDFARICGK
jgi:hypothetical protein